MGPLKTPFGLNPMRPKCAKGAIPQAPTPGGPQSGPPIHKAQKCPKIPNWPVPSKGPIKQVMASRSNQRAPATFSCGSPSKKRKPFPTCEPKPVGTRNGAYKLLYTIMHQFFSEIQGLCFQELNISSYFKSPLPHSISKEGFKVSFLQSMVGSSRPFKDTNHLALQVFVESWASIPLGE
ncbi:hypothetical protein O181_060756 [Austropuccinia psidii MF-1]|uniref:Uncharacterized protein n=1 Tax=Austropuccinia psidii MF-1 TaxID=1389203 RepID=A0A9Q3EER3_9BASI|nr:hypothetical protein [Austropuccinia psidii MF-1]